MREAAREIKRKRAIGRFNNFNRKRNDRYGSRCLGVVVGADFAVASQQHKNKQQLLLSWRTADVEDGCPGQGSYSTLCVCVYVCEDAFSTVYVCLALFVYLVYVSNKFVDVHI